jgi:hypothetical protein
MQARKTAMDPKKLVRRAMSLRRNGLIHLVVEAGHAINESVGINLRNGISNAGGDFAPVCPGSVAHSRAAIEAGVLGAGEIGRLQKALVERVALGVLGPPFGCATQTDY